MNPPLLDLVRFARLYGTEKLRACSPSVLLEYLAAAREAGHVIAPTHNGEIVGIGIAWPVLDRGDDPAAYRKPWDPVAECNPSGAALYIANFAAGDPKTVRQMIYEASNKWPSIRKFIGHRETPRGQIVRVYPIKAAARLHHLTV